jgi:DNA-binding FrmR family transcriptional regulator
MARKRAGFVRYIKEAFLYRWNVLIFGAAAVAAVISGHADIALPLVAAGELAYLAGLSTQDKFQKAIDIKAIKEAKGGKLLETGDGEPVSRQARLGAMLGGLSHGSRVRFQRLRSRCIEMQRIAKGVTGQSSTSPTAADDLRTPALDKLLWVFLRLLYSQQALQKFLAATDEEAIKQRISALEKRKETAEKKGDERILRSVIDSVTTETLRLDNYQKAEANADFVAVELDRIEGKISAIIEMGVSNQDAEYISSQVDAVADSMAMTEEAISDLQSITGLTSELDEPPSILESDTEMVEA